MAYIYCADVWCDDCGNDIRRRLAKEGIAPADPDDEQSYDSDDFPKHAEDDDVADTPQHCAAGEDCINAIKIGKEDDNKIGLLFGELTCDGINYVEEAIAGANHDSQTWNREIVGLWYQHYSDRGYRFRISPSWIDRGLETRLLTLERVSGLHVECYKRQGVRYFVFGPKDRTIKSVCTYQRAKVFAEGVAIGRNLR